MKNSVNETRTTKTICAIKVLSVAIYLNSVWYMYHKNDTQNLKAMPSSAINPLSCYLHNSFVAWPFQEEKYAKHQTALIGFGAQLTICLRCVFTATARWSWVFSGSFSNHFFQLTTTGLQTNHVHCYIEAVYSWRKHLLLCTSPGVGHLSWVAMVSSSSQVGSSTSIPCSTFCDPDSLSTSFIMHCVLNKLSLVPTQAFWQICSSSHGQCWLSSPWNKEQLW